MVGRLYWQAVLAVARLAATLSQRLRLGAGSVIAGRVVLGLYPTALARLAAGRITLLVTGTNGKTTTSHLLAAALAERSPIAHNATGSNMPDGAVAALMARPRAAVAVLEVDELHLSAVLDATGADVLVALNLSRDQLDRVSEIRSTAVAMTALLDRHPHTRVVANADDPLVVWAVRAHARTVWVSVGTRWRADTLSCPACGRPLTAAPPPDRAPAGGDESATVASGGSPRPWHCTGCDLHRPTPAWTLDTGTRDGGTAANARRHGAASVPLVVGLPGRVNLGNAVFALAAAAAVGTDPVTAAPQLARVSEAAGRYAFLYHQGRRVRVLLVKNPAGWGEAVEMLTPGRPLLMVINAREADGRDVSWLWDLPMTGLGAGPVAAAGDRAADLGVRLSYAGVAHRTDSDPRAALEALPPGDIDAVANYTAFLDLRRQLAAHPPSRDASAASAAPQPPSPESLSPDTPPPVPARRRRGVESRVGIAVLLPDLLGTYSDTGNASVLAQRLRWRGMAAEIVEVTSADAPPDGCEFYLLGGGEDTAQEAAAAWLRRHRSLATTLTDRAVTFAVCAGMQLLGHATTDLRGLSHPGLGLLDLTTRPGPRRTLGEALSTATPPAVGTLTGFHNHRGVSLLGPHAMPLARVQQGPGNHPDTDAEGALSPTCSGGGRSGPGIAATYLHGPVLARNPALADHLLTRALGTALPDLDPTVLPDLAGARGRYLGRRRGIPAR